MIKAGNEYEENAIRFFMQAYGVKPDPYTVVIVRKAGMSQTADGLTVPKDKKQYVIFLSPSASGAELIRLIAHEVAHVCQIIKGDLEFANVGGSIKVYWHDEEVNVDKVPYRKRPWEVEAYTLEKKYVHDFVNKYGNQLQESKMKTFEEYIQPLDEAAGLAPNEWLADMERSWRMHYVRLNNKVEALAKESLDKGQFKDFKKAQGEFSSAVSTFQYLFDIMADYNKGNKQ